MKKIIYPLILWSFVTSCGVKRLGVQDYINYHSTHREDYSVKTNLTSSSATLTYYPLDYFLAESYLDSVPAKELKELKANEQKKENTAFTLQFDFNKGSLLAQSNVPKEQQMKFYAVNFKHNISAVTSANDTIPCTNYIFEANGNFGNSARFDFEIPVKKESIHKILIYNPYLPDSIIEFDGSKYATTTYPELKIK